MNPSSTQTNVRGRVEFDIHGIIGVRLVDPSPNDIAAVTKQLGPLQKPLGREPDLTLRFVKHFSTARLRRLGSKNNAFSDDGFFVFEEGVNSIKAKIPFERLGWACEIICESGLPSVPLLMPILSVMALAKGYVALHASAFVYNGVGVLMAGGANSGKTTTLLGFASRGAEFIGEEWVLLGEDGQTMRGLPAEIELSFGHLDNFPHLRHTIQYSKAWLFEGLRSLNKIHRMIPAGKINRAFPVKALRRILAALERRLAPKVTPLAAFGNRVGPLAATPDQLFLLGNHGDLSVQIEVTPPGEMVRRIMHLVQQEQKPLLEYYQAFTLAFPNMKNAVIERAQGYQRTILSRALMDMQTYTVWHPYPLTFSDLFRQIEPLLQINRRKRMDTIGDRIASASSGGDLACKPSTPIRSFDEQSEAGIQVCHSAEQDPCRSLI